jgi:uncharacterized protein YjdB
MRSVLQFTGSTSCTGERSLFFTLVTFLFLLTPLSVSATEYFVSPSGNNFNAGNIGSPFRTINYGISRLKAGDKLNIRAGTYRELISVYGISGTENSPVIIRAYQGETPVIDGNGISVEAGGGLVIIWKSYIHFTGCDVRNSSRSGIVCATDAHHCVISGCRVSNIRETGIGYYGNFGTIEKCTVYDACLSNSDGIYTPPEVWGAGINMRNQSVARNNVIHDVWGEGLSITMANYAIVEDNIIYDVASVLLYVMNCQDCIIRRNLVYMTKTMGDISSVGLGHWNEVYENQNARNIIINNVVYNCRRNFDNDSPMRGTLVANNTFMNSSNTDLWNVQITGGNSVSGSFRNNIVMQDGSLPCIYAEPGSGIIFSNNLYNKSYDPNAKGPGDIRDDPALTMNGETTPGKLSAAYFRLTSTSPAIDKGIALPEIVDDIFRYKRNGFPDIGANEYYDPGLPVKVTGITVHSDRGLTTVFKGETVQLTAEVVPSDASDKSILWSVSDITGAATISSNGTFTAISPGTVKVTAAAQDDSGVSATLEITVVELSSDILHMYIYPNPATDHFNFSVQPASSLQLSLIIADLTGRIVMNDPLAFDSGELVIPVNFADGIYIVHLCSGNEVYDSGKLVIGN